MFLKAPTPGMPSPAVGSLNPVLTHNSASPSTLVDAALADELAVLLSLVASGCTKSFEGVYERTSRRVFSVILRINTDRAEAEDVLQETYVKVWHQSKQFDPSRGQASTWLMCIARNGAIDSVKRKRARPNLSWHTDSEADNPLDDFPSLDAGPFETLAAQQHAAAVRRCLHALPADQRQCLALAFYEGLTHQEVASQMGRPLGTVKSWLRRSLLSLKESLAPVQ